MKTTDDTVVVFRSRDLASAQVCRLPKGAELGLSHASNFEGRQWMEALLPDGMSGYVLGPTVLGHTTAGSAIDPRAHFDADLGAASPDSETAEPYLTRLSLLTTVVITLAIVADLVHQPENWGGILQGAVLFALPLIGLFVNSFLGSAADARGEYGAWPVALIGPAVWFLTILVIYLVRGRSFW